MKIMFVWRVIVQEERRAKELMENSLTSVRHEGLNWIYIRWRINKVLLWERSEFWKERNENIISNDFRLEFDFRLAKLLCGCLRCGFRFIMNSNLLFFNGTAINHTFLKSSCLVADFLSWDEDLGFGGRWNGVRLKIEGKKEIFMISFEETSWKILRKLHGN